MVNRHTNSCIKESKGAPIWFPDIWFDDLNDEKQ